MAQLTGITWDHTRGYLPMLATAQRFHELHPDVEIVWHKRSLKAFGDQPLQQLVSNFDLLVIDHPFVGYAAAHNVLLPLDAHLPASFLADQAANSVGASHPSYTYGGHHWALAIDAATPVSCWRPDRLAAPPETWEALLDLARAGRVAVPGAPIDSLMHYYMLCIALGDAPFQRADRHIDPETGAGALELLRELLLTCGSANLLCNPIQTYEALLASDALAYCPFAYGYSNYARAGYAAHALRFGGLVTYAGRQLRSVLGGTGLAIAANCTDIPTALAYAEFVAEAATQRGLYLQAGGQPGHRAAWEDEAANVACGGFFRDTLPTLDAAFLRPRYDGYMHFQDEAQQLVHAYLCDGGDARAAVAAVERLYQSTIDPTILSANPR